jgi:hypothetical protein
MRNTDAVLTRIDEMDNFSWDDAASSAACDLEDEDEPRQFSEYVIALGSDFDTYDVLTGPAARPDLAREPVWAVYCVMTVGEDDDYADIECVAGGLTVREAEALVAADPLRARTPGADSVERMTAASRQVRNPPQFG